MKATLPSMAPCYSCGDPFPLEDLEEREVDEVVVKQGKDHKTHLVKTGKRVKKLVCASCVDVV